MLVLARGYTEKLVSGSRNSGNRMRKCVTYAAAALLVSVAALSPSEKSEAAPAKKVLLKDYLYVLANTFDCYFTIEEMPRGAGNWIEFLEVEPVKKTLSIEEMVERLGNQLPGVRVARSKANPAIVHLIDTRLDGAKDYVLETRLTLCYGGTLEGLVQLLSFNHDAFAGRQQRMLSELYFDWTTHIGFVVNEVPMRRVFADYLPLSEYQRLLWIARTRLVRDKYKTQMLFPGGVDRTRRLTLADGKSIDFSRGEDCLLYKPDGLTGNPESDSTKAAINFIKERMAAERPLHIRWAMLFLGACRSENGIPVLLKYLDYKYTACGVREESYPALKSLRLIGKPSVEASAKQILVEQTGARIELLCHVIISIEGKEKTQEILGAEMSKAKNEDQKKRLQIALDYCHTCPSEEVCN